MTRREYEMSEAAYDALLKACKPTPVMFLSGGQPMFDSPQENANTAWKALGDEMGFDHMTVFPISGKSGRFFTAEPKPDASSTGQPAGPDYTALEGGDILQALGDDASKWAEAYCQHAIKFGFDRNDREIMVTWFANAIEHSHDVRMRRSRPDTTPIVGNLNPESR